MKTYAEVIVNSDALDIDKPFTYEIGEELKEFIKIGQLVKVPFGVKNNPIDGFVLGIKEEEPIKGIRIKKLKSITFEDEVLSNDDLKLVDFLRENYLCKYIDAIRLLIPHGVLKGTKNKSKKVIVWVRDIVDNKKSEDYIKILNFIKLNNGLYTKAQLTK
ncbi:MAG: primosomal protein N', partial [Clostridium sp.]